MTQSGHRRSARNASGLPGLSHGAGSGVSLRVGGLRNGAARKITAMAAKDKCLAARNKSGASGAATKRRREMLGVPHVPRPLGRGTSTS
jgi:hypothetical protein